MKVETLLLPERKVLRANVIERFVSRSRFEGVVVFSCGNASKALREQGLRIVDISPDGLLQTKGWWDMLAIHRVFPRLFNATSGYLPLPMMVEIAGEFRHSLGELSESVAYNVPTGSGETILCLKIAYPKCTFYPKYNVEGLEKETKLDDMNPINEIIKAFFLGD